MHSPKSTIIVGVDFSPGSAAALALAIDIANRCHATLRALHIIPDEDNPSFGINDRHNNVTEIVRVANQRLATFVKETVAEHDIQNIKTDAFLGNRFGGLMQAAREYHAALLVMGAHGLGHPYTKEPSLLSMKCVRHAPCDVLLTSNWDAPKKILVGIDYSPSSKLALQRATLLGQLWEVEVLALHVYRPPGDFLRTQGFDELPLTDEQQAHYHQHARDTMDSFIKEMNLPKPNCSQVISDPNPLNGFLRAQQETGANVIVIGAEGHSAADEVTMGTFAERVFTNALCPVMAVKPCSQYPLTSA